MSTLEQLAALYERGLASPDDDAALREVIAGHALRIPADYLARIAPNPDDPLARQVVPSTDELRVLPSDLADPIGDHARQASPLLIHRYPSRALLVPTLACPVHCRFCFRKARINAPETLTPETRDQALAYLAAHAEITEVILTGGEPLLLSPARLHDLVGRLTALGTLRRLRLHTRAPVVIPSRVTDAHVAALTQGLPLQVAVHVNHPRELAPDTLAALKRFRDAGALLLSQTVLLAGVNDQADILAELFEALLDHQVKPYYLHHPDRVPGTAHFRVSLARGIALMAALRGRLSGPALPTYVLDIPGGFGKVPVDSHFVQLLSPEEEPSAPPALACPPSVPREGDAPHAKTEPSVPPDAPHANTERPCLSSHALACSPSVPREGDAPHANTEPSVPPDAPHANTERPCLSSHALACPPSVPREGDAPHANTEPSVPPDAPHANTERPCLSSHANTERPCLSSHALSCPPSVPPEGDALSPALAVEHCPPPPAGRRRYLVKSPLGGSLLLYEDG